jgi:hypothetical protein
MHREWTLTKSTGYCGTRNKKNHFHINFDKIMIAKSFDFSSKEVILEKNFMYDFNYVFYGNKYCLQFQLAMNMECENG